MVSGAPPRFCERATENPECQTPWPLPVLRTPDELPQSLAVLSESLSHLARMAESPHSRATVNVGARCLNSYVSTRCCYPGSCTHGRVRGGSLEEPAAVTLHGGICEGGASASHGGLKRARNWKRWIQPKKTYSFAGLLYSERCSLVFDLFPAATTTFANRRGEPRVPPVWDAGRSAHHL